MDTDTDLNDTVNKNEMEILMETIYYKVYHEVTIILKSSIKKKE